MIWGEPDECSINELKADMEGTNSTGFSRNLSSELLLGDEAGDEVESSSNESTMIEQQHEPNTGRRSIAPLDEPDDPESESEKEIPVDDDDECLEEAAHNQEDMSADDEHEYLENRRIPRDDQEDRRGNPVTDGDCPTAEDGDKSLGELRLGQDPGTQSAKKGAKR
jgi:hypothetical protein